MSDAPFDLDEKGITKSFERDPKRPEVLCTLDPGKSVKVSFGFADGRGTEISVTAYGPNQSSSSDTKWVKRNAIVPSRMDDCYVYLRY